jgi:hypothetical protein
MTNDLMQVPGVTIGIVSAVDSTGSPIVRFQNEEIAAAVVWMPTPPQWADCIGGRVVLSLLDGDERQPIVLGLLDPPQLRVDADGTPEVLHVESTRALVIECGEAKIVLREDGRIEIRGTHIISRSSGPNKLKGGSVHIN